MQASQDVVNRHERGGWEGEGVGEGAGKGDGGGDGVGEGAGEGEREGEAKEKEEETRERAREKEQEREQAREMEGERKKVKKKREKVEMGRAMTHRMAVISGASQPTLALGRQTSNCHVGQDKCGRLTSDSFWTISSGTARCSSTSSGRLPSEHWTDS